MDKSTAIGVLDAARERVAGVSLVDLRLANPGCFEAWRAGAIRPCWISVETDRSGLSREDLAAVLDSPVESLTEVEAGNIYPSWSRVCRLAAALDIPLERLLFDVPDRETPEAFDTDLSSSVAAIMAAQFHPAVVEPIVSSAFGLTGEGVTEETMKAARAGRERAMKAAAATAAERHGFHDLAKALRAEADAPLALIRGGYGPRLSRFRHALFNAADIDDNILESLAHLPKGQSNDGTGTVKVSTADVLAAGRAPLASMGPVRSHTVEGVVLMFVGDISDQGLMLEDPQRDGSVITISVSAHNAETDERVAVPEAEARVWVNAILGDSWIEHVLEAGPRTGISGTLTTVYFHLFIGPDGKAQQSPAGFPAGTPSTM